MSELSSISGSFAGRATSHLRLADEQGRGVGAQIEAKGVGRSADSVELSERARQIAALRASQSAEETDGDVRTELIERIRQEIADGTYDTHEKLTAAAWRVSKELDLNG